jgi:hypothetical protein
MGKTGMAVANGSYFIVWENGVGIEFFDWVVVCRGVTGNFLITAPSDGLFCLTDSSF